MKNNRQITDLSDHALAGRWLRTGHGEYIAVLSMRYLPFLYGFFLNAQGESAKARGDVRLFIQRFPSLLQIWTGMDDFAPWLYATLTAYLRERRGAKQDEKTNLTPVQKSLITRLSARDEWAAVLFENTNGRLDDFQRKCMEMFFIGHETFETISRRTGGTPDKVKRGIATGVASLFPDGDATALIADGAAGDDKAFEFSFAKYSPAFTNYLKGRRGDATAYEIEAASMIDPFLSEAVEGCLNVGGDHAAIIGELEREVEETYPVRRGHSSRTIIFIAIVAAAIAVAAILTYRYIQARPGGGNETKKEMPVPIPLKPDDGANIANNMEGTNGAAAGNGVRETVTNEGSTLPRSVNAQGDTSAGQGGPAVANGTEAPVRLVSISEERDEAGRAHYISVPRIGMQGYNEYLRKAAVKLEGNSRGDVTLTFKVNRYGRPSQIRVTENLSKEAHREAIRLLENGPEWSPSETQVAIVLRFE